MNSVNTAGGASGTSDSSIELPTTPPITSRRSTRMSATSHSSRESRERELHAVPTPSVNASRSRYLPSWRLWNAEDEDVQPESPAEQRSRRRKERLSKEPKQRLSDDEDHQSGALHAV